MTGGRQIVFITGSGHSGSTLLDMCLGGHTDVAALGETGFLYYYAQQTSSRDFCTCGKTIDDCPFWSRVTETLAARRDVPKEKALDDFILSDPDQVLLDDKGNYKDRLPSEKQPSVSYIRPFIGVLGSGRLFKFFSNFSPLLAKRLRAAGNRMLLLDATLDAHGRKVVVDSTKSPGTVKEAYMLRSDTPVRFITIYRDGRGVAASHMRRMGIPMTQAATLWRNEILKWQLARLTIPRKNMMTVRYEDFAQNPEKELRTICTWLGLDYDPKMLSFREDRHNVGGNMMRFRTDEVHIRLDERWRRELTPEQLTEFDKTAGWLNRRLGYGS